MNYELLQVNTKLWKYSKVGIESLKEKRIMLDESIILAINKIIKRGIAEKYQPAKELLFIPTTTALMLLRHSKQTICQIHCTTNIQKYI